MLDDLIFKSTGVFDTNGALKTKILQDGAINNNNSLSTHVTYGDAFPAEYKPLAKRTLSGIAKLLGDPLNWPEMTVQNPDGTTSTTNITKLINEGSINIGQLQAIAEQETRGNTTVIYPNSQEEKLAKGKLQNGVGELAIVTHDIATGKVVHTPGATGRNATTAKTEVEGGHVIQAGSLALPFYSTKSGAEGKSVAYFSPDAFKSKDWSDLQEILSMGVAYENAKNSAAGTAQMARNFIETLPDAQKARYNGEVKKTQTKQVYRYLLPNGKEGIITF